MFLLYVLLYYLVVHPSYGMNKKVSRKDVLLRRTNIKNHFVIFKRKNKLETYFCLGNTANAIFKNSPSILFCEVSDQPLKNKCFSYILLLLLKISLLQHCNKYQLLLHLCYFLFWKLIYDLPQLLKSPRTACIPFMGAVNMVG